MSSSASRRSAVTISDDKTDTNLRDFFVFQLLYTV